MGHSKTIHCIGEKISGKLAYAMTKIEAYQEQIKANKESDPIKFWYSQTMTGEKILNGKETSLVKMPKGLIGCPACFMKGCFVCNYSGYTTKKHFMGFQDWQIERIKQCDAGYPESKLDY